MRLTKHQKRMSSTAGSADHALFGSKKHTDDVKHQRAFLAKVFPSDTAMEKELTSLPFPNSLELGKSFKISKNKEGELIPVPLDDVKDDSGAPKSDEIRAFRRALSRQFSYYYRKGDKKKDGTFYTKPQKTNGVIENSISFGIGWSKVLKKESEKGNISTQRLGEIFSEIGLKLSKKLSERSGYIPLYFNFHPESVSNPHFHFGLGTLDPETHLLVGRSANGKRGKKGLRLLRPSFLNTWRNSRCYKLSAEEKEIMESDFLQTPRKAFDTYKQNFDGTEKTSHSGYDDVALSLYMDELFTQYFPKLVSQVNKEKSHHATLWAKEKIKTGRTKSQILDKFNSVSDELNHLKSLVQKIPNSKIIKHLIDDNAYLKAELAERIKDPFRPYDQARAVDQIASLAEARPRVLPLVHAKLEQAKQQLKALPAAVPLIPPALEEVS